MLWAVSCDAASVFVLVRAKPARSPVPKILSRCRTVSASSQARIPPITALSPPASSRLRPRRQLTPDELTTVRPARIPPNESGGEHSSSPKCGGAFLVPRGSVAVEAAGRTERHASMGALTAIYPTILAPHVRRLITSPPEAALRQALGDSDAPPRDQLSSSHSPALDTEPRSPPILHSSGITSDNSCCQAVVAACTRPQRASPHPSARTVPRHIDAQGSSALGTAGRWPPNSCAGVAGRSCARASAAAGMRAAGAHGTPASLSDAST
jgi:hypothetical protein